MLLKTSTFGVFRWLRQYILDMRVIAPPEINDSVYYDTKVRVCLL